MKRSKTIILTAFLMLNFQVLNAQGTNKLTAKALDKDFIELRNTLKEINAVDNQKSVDLSLEALDKFENKYLRYYLIFWELSYDYARMDQFDKCFEILKKGQDEGLFYYLGTESRVFPPYREEIENMEGYESFRLKNNELREAASKTANTEFMVQLPENYDPNASYPLMLIMHGGIGDIAALQYFYQSEKLSSEFIVAYTHGSRLFGSGSRAYNNNHWRNSIKKIYQEITADYAVDTSKVILGGPSAGSYRSLVLGLNNDIPAKGLLLSFAVNPRNWDSTIFINSAERGLKAALLCGENDWAIKDQKKLGYWFDQYGIQNRFVVFPEEGHNFPKNWAYYLESSLDFLMEEE